MSPIQPTRITTPSDLEIEITRNFDAPRALVARAFTDPVLLQRWMGVFGDWSWASCDMDVRVGGMYRWVWRQPNGAELALSGAYREVVPAERYMQTQVYENMPDFPGEMLATMTLVDDDSGTRVTQVVRYASQAERDLDLKYMPNGLEPGFQALDALLATEARA
ncbi:MAG: SRPBCC domain-containing protein [Dehalococcoidia bacterium]|nr:SRPBCC domain-containing protein [Dehalococcoidia bacterium]